MIILLKSVQSYDLCFQISMGYYVEKGPIAKSQRPILKRSAPVGYAAEYLTLSFLSVCCRCIIHQTNHCALYHFSLSLGQIAEDLVHQP